MVTLWFLKIFSKILKLQILDHLQEAWYKKQTAFWPQDLASIKAIKDLYEEEEMESTDMSMIEQYGHRTSLRYLL